jgi:hypothetical protein
MPTPLELVAALKDYGVTVVQEPGWITRGTGYPFHPYGQAIHHDALHDGVSDAAAIRLMIQGRPDLSGPLCNDWHDSDGTVHLIAWGNANHAGRNEADVHARLKAGLPPLGDARLDPDEDTVIGNSFLWGRECRNAGDGRDPWEQMEAMHRASAAIADCFGWSSDAIAGHRELTKRKPDPAGFSMFDFRAAVKRIRYEHDQPDVPTTPSMEDPMLIIRLSNPKHSMLCIGGRLFAGHEGVNAGAIVKTETTPVVMVNEERWTQIVATLGPVVG